MRSASAISVRDVEKRFGTFTALSGMSLDIADNEFFTLLGPSGCGKTTLLRMIAGFEDTTSGTIFLYDEEIENLPPDKRPVNTVFQNYALFPHMDVSENIGFGLRMLGWSTADSRARIAEMIALVKLEAFAHRTPAQLSGGQQQRVALARAMAPRPKVLLLDEPLSALDLKLRQAMRGELKTLQRETGITFVFVTHDQEEALSMSDRIAVMSAGRLQQIGTPSDIYEHPTNRFVASFIGETNLLDASVLDAREGRLRCRLANGHLVETLSPEPLAAGTPGTVSIRPEQLSIRTESHVRGADGEEDWRVRDGLEVEPEDRLAGVLGGTLESSVYLGTDVQYEIALDGGLSVSARRQNVAGEVAKLAPGDRVQVRIADGAARFLVD